MDIIEIHFGQGLRDMHRRMERMMEDLIERSRPYFRGEKGHWMPATDVYETQEGIVILSEIAGMKKEEIRVVLDGDLLSISGTRKGPVSERKVRMHQMELEFGDFERLIRVPVDVDPEGIRATYDSGFLRVFLPKKWVAKRVEIVAKP